MLFRSLPDREVGTDGLDIGRWRRYEAESYLLHPSALERFVESRTEPLFQQAARKVLEEQLPPAVLRSPLGEHDIYEALRSSKTLLPKLFEAAGLSLPKRDYYLVAEQMRREELAPEVEEKLNTIATHLGIT